MLASILYPEFSSRSPEIWVEENRYERHQSTEGEAIYYKEATVAFLVEGPL
jgi:hypothetical protein